MRAAALLLALGLTACTPTVEMPTVPTSFDRVTPDAEGLQPVGSDLRIDFGRAQEGVIDAVTRLLGQPPVEITRNGECGAGLVTAARWPNGLTLNFLEGDFRGWVVDQPGLPAGGLEVGQLPPAVEMTETSLGQEFQRNGVWALVLPEGPQVVSLWSGTTCFFR